MKIILASDISFLLKYGYNLTGISKENMRIGYVTTASKGARTDANLKYRQMIYDENYNLQEIDIEGKSCEELLSFFKDKNIIQVEGGNTFYLLNAIRKSGFEEALKILLNKGLVYIGTSAGSYIMCPTIEVSDWSDESISRWGVSDFKSLNYVPFVLRVHYKDEKEEEVKEKMKNLKHPLRILHDGEGIFCENDVCKFYGDKEETVIKP